MPRELATLPGVDILATGTWRLVSGEQTFTSDDLADAIDASTCPSIGPPRIKIGHVDPRFDGEPAVGWVKDMRLSSNGQKITGDLTEMPAWLGEVAASAYPSRSIEGKRDFVCQQGHTHKFVITGLALLGVTPPAIGVLNGISDIPVLFDVAAAAGGSGQAFKTMQPQPQEELQATAQRLVAGLRERRLARQQGAGMPSNRFGRLSPQQADAMIASLKETLPPHQAAEWTRAVELLTDHPAGSVHASAPAPDDGELDDDLRSLWPPRTAEEAERRFQQQHRRIAASRPDDDDDDALYRAVFGDLPGSPR